MLHIAESIRYCLGANVEAPRSQLSNGYGLTAGSGWGVIADGFRPLPRSPVDLNCSVIR